MTVVTGANALFFRCLQQLLLSLPRWQVPGCLVYDLGLSDPQRCDLIRRFPWIELRIVPNGPEHLRDVGNYAWKPTIMAEVLSQQSEPALWLDSACVVVGSLEPVIEHVRQHGLWVPWAGRGPVCEMTHPATLTALAVESAIERGRFRAGGVCAFDPARPEVLELVRSWRELAWCPEILAPPGSHRSNHRYDQTLLTVLLARSSLDPSDHEVDISSSRPISFLRTRNKVNERIPLALDPWVRAYFWFRRFLDVAHWQWRELRRNGL